MYKDSLLKTEELINKFIYCNIFLNKEYPAIHLITLQQVLNEVKN
jgi:hypothetical protein